jgi:methyl-accepting chemotaxis protein
MSFFGLSGQKGAGDHGNGAGKLDAIDRSQAVIEFDLDGTIRTANRNFLSAVGYDLSEIAGRHHSMFVEPGYAAGQAYKEFWATLARGQFQSGEYKRFAKGNKEIWIQASYNPILDANGKPTGVVKFATDITEQKRKAADADGKINAISRSQAVIEFTMTGEIIDANDNFLNAMGYRLDEIRGRHHRMFAEPEYASSQAYQDFWAALGRGEFQGGEYKRLAKGGKEIWIQATYNPVFDSEGKPIKVVKFATDITARKSAINDLDTALQQLAGGDLRTSINKEFPGDLETLRLAYNRSVEQFGDLAQQIRATAGEVENAASEIASGTSDLSQRTEQAASSLEETAASTEELSATVKQNAQNATEASQLADEANRTASSGGEVVEQAVAAMSGIENSAQKITDIIGVIDEIAFQTNLLALNASVEAARAGEAGKGFAVVAQEVRQLAQRSSQAASDISNLIQDSNGQVKKGVQLVNQAGEALGEILGSINKVAGIVRQISSASQEQSVGVQEINTSVANMDEMTQQNSALVEQSTAAARALSDQASRLSQLIDFFKLEGSATTTPARRATPAPVPRARQKPAPKLANANEGWDEF